MTRLRQLQRWVVAGAAALAVAVSVLDFAGILDRLPWMDRDRLQAMVLLLCAAILMLLLEDRATLGRIQRTLREIQLEGFARLADHVDPALERVFGDYIVDLAQTTASAISEKRVRFYGVDRLREFYGRTLQAYRRSTFYATSVPSKSYFWRDESALQPIREFIDGGGKMERIFFTDVPFEELGDEARGVVLQHVEAKVTVYVLPTAGLPPDRIRFFLVESRGRIAWESSIGGSRQIVRSVATSDRGDTRAFVTLFEELRKRATPVSPMR